MHFTTESERQQKTELRLCSATMTSKNKGFCIPPAKVKDVSITDIEQKEEIISCTPFLEHNEVKGS